MANGFEIYNWLRFCPFCGKELEISPNSGLKSCFLHGEFIVKENESVEASVEFKLMSFFTKKPTVVR